MSSPVDRQAARVLLVDADDRVLLLRGTDPGDPSQGEWWFTPGGGLDPGELPVEAACRELAEETGLVISPGDLGPEVHQRVAHFTFGGRAYRQAEVFYLVRVERHVVDTAGWTPLEVASVLEHRWWPRRDLTTTRERIYPDDLVAVLERALAGALGP